MLKPPDIRPWLLSVIILLGSISSAISTEKLGIGTALLPEQLNAWDIDVRADGQGLPIGKGTAIQGEAHYQEKCAACHGEFGEGKDRWPVLAGGQGSLTSDRPEKTIGSFWPHASTAFDYIRRAMPFGNGQSLTPDETYAIVAYLLNMNDVIKDDFELNEKTLPKIILPNANAFYEDDREKTEAEFWKKNPCMKDCKPPAKVTKRAAIIDVTPDSKTAPRVE